MHWVFRCLSVLVILSSVSSAPYARSEMDQSAAERKYTELERRYKQMRAEGIDLSSADSLVSQIKRARSKQDWSQLVNLLGSLEDRLTRLQLGFGGTPPAHAASSSRSKAFLAGRPLSENELLSALSRSPEYRQLLDYRGDRRLVDESGAVGRNIAGYKDVAAQRDAMWLMMRGLSEHDEWFVERSVRALEFAFRFQESAGNFRNEHGVSARKAVGADAFFLQSFGHLYEMLSQSGYRSKYLHRLNALRPALAKAMTWLLANVDELHRQDARATNRLGFDALAFLLNGRNLQDPALLATGKDFIEKVVRSQRPDGVFPEHGGYDSSYQAVTVLTLSLAWMYLEDGSFKERVYAAIQNAVHWEKSRIRPNGEVMVEGNKRTGLGQEKLFGKPKDVNYPEVALAFLVWSEISGDRESAELGGKVIRYLFTARRPAD